MCIIRCHLQISYETKGAVFFCPSTQLVLTTVKKKLVNTQSMYFNNRELRFSIFFSREIHWAVVFNIRTYCLHLYQNQTGISLYHIQQKQMPSVNWEERKLGRMNHVAHRRHLLLLNMVQGAAFLVLIEV